MQIKLIFTRKFVHLASFWKWGFLELGSGRLLNVIHWNRPRADVGSLVGTSLPWVLINPYPSSCDATLPFSSIVHDNENYTVKLFIIRVYSLEQFVFASFTSGISAFSLTCAKVYSLTSTPSSNTVSRRSCWQKKWRLACVVTLQNAQSFLSTFPFSV